MPTTAPHRKATARLPKSDYFCTTRWTVVLAARGQSPEAQVALETLCSAYYEPIVAYLSRATRDPHGARDLAHEFCAQLLQGDRLQHVRQEGKFRAYLSGALKHYLAHRFEFEGRLRRGGRIEQTSLDTMQEEGREQLTDEKVPTPDAAFDRAWATTLLGRALAALRAECTAEGRLAHFEQLKPWLTGEGSHGGQALLAAHLGVDAGTLKSSVHRLRRRFRTHVKAEIAATLSPSADVEEEMRALFAALSS